MISCLECGIQFNHIGVHLHKHNISTKEYLQKYSNAVLSNKIGYLVSIENILKERIGSNI